jgi:hypothetical protein
LKLPSLLSGKQLLACLGLEAIHFHFNFQFSCGVRVRRVRFARSPAESVFDSHYLGLILGTLVFGDRDVSLSHRSVSKHIMNSQNASEQPD